MGTPAEFGPFEVISLINDATTASLTGDVESALELAQEVVDGADVDYLFSIRARYLLADGMEQWVSLTPLTPLSGLPLALVAMLEKAEQMLQFGSTGDVEGEQEAGPQTAELEETAVYLTLGRLYWQG